MRFLKYLSPFVLVVMMPLLTLAQTTFSVKVPTIVGVGEPFRVEFIANGVIESFEAPSFEGFNIIAGPSTSRGTDIKYVNGELSKTITHTYTFVVVAEKKGNSKIGAASATIDGSVYNTRSTPIEVAVDRSNGGSSQSSSSSSGQSGQSGQSRQTRQPSSQIQKDDIILRAEPSRSTVYKGEPVLVALKLYTRAQVSNLTSFRPATFNGFWQQEVPMVPKEMVRATLNGKIYETTTLKEFLLFPQKSGKLKIESMDISLIAVVINENAGGGGGSLFDSFFGGMSSYINVEKEAKSAPVTINVKELPSGAPASFNGAVGEFTMSAKLNENKMSANASGSINLTVSGSGNLPLISTPDIELPGAFELYPSKTKDNYKVVGSNVKGSKRFDYPFIARSEGEFTLPPVKFTYFSTSKKQYVTLSSADFNLDVLKDITGGDVGANVINGVSKKELKILGKDIHFIKIGDSDLSPKGDFIIGSLGYLLALFITVILFVISLFYLNKRIKELRDTVRVKSKKANKVARTRLKAAKRYMGDNMDNEFYSEMLRALSGYISDKLNIEVAKLSKEYIKEQLELKNVVSADIDQLLNTISNCEFAQYAPSASVKMGDIYNQTLNLIGRLESKL